MQRTDKVFKMVKDVRNSMFKKAGWHFRHFYCDPRLTLLAVDKNQDIYFTFDSKVNTV